MLSAPSKEADPSSPIAEPLSPIAEVSDEKASSENQKRKTINNFDVDAAAMATRNPKTISLGPATSWRKVQGKYSAS